MNFIIIIILLSLLLNYTKRNSNFSWYKISTFIIFGIGLQVISKIVIPIVDLFISTENGFNMMNQSIMGSNFIFALLSVGIITPIIEEYIFRKCIQSKLLTKFNIKITLLLQSLIFGVLHFNMYQLFPTIILGLIFGYFYHKFKSLYAPIILHASCNSYAIIGVRLIENNNLFWFFPIISLIIGLFLLYTSSKNETIILSKN